MERSLSEALLQVSNLSVHFAGRRTLFRGAPPPVKAVQDVSFSVAPREIVGLVGESGSGKSSLARAILRLISATSGSVRFEGVELLGLEGRALKDVRRGMQVIFQDPYASLNPRMTAGQNIAEGLVLQGQSARLIPAAVADLLHQVGLSGEAGGAGVAAEVEGAVAGAAGGSGSGTISPMFKVRERAAISKTG